MEQPTLNSHNKEEHRPSHTAEHLLNQTMVRMFGNHENRGKCNILKNNRQNILQFERKTLLLQTK